MPSAASSSALPTPESCSSCGELMAPPQRITSPAYARRERAPAVRVLDADRALAVEDDPGDERPRPHGEVGPLHHRVQVGPGRGQPPPAADGAVEPAEALLPLAVDVVGGGIAGLPGRLEQRPEERVGGRAAFQHQRAVVAAERVVGVGGEARLHPVEVRQAVGVVPGLHAGVGGPALVVQRVAALEDHAVDAAGAAEHLAPGVVDPPAVHVRLGLGLVLPVVEPAADRERQRRRHVDEDVPRVVGAARLEHQHPVGGSAESRLASAQPADPPPTMTKS